MPLFFTSLYHGFFLACHIRFPVPFPNASLRPTSLFLSSQVSILTHYRPLPLSIHSSSLISTLLGFSSLPHLTHPSLSPVPLSLFSLWIDSLCPRTRHDALWLLPHSPLALILIYALYWICLYKSKEFLSISLVKMLFSIMIIFSLSPEFTPRLLLTSSL